MDIDVPLRELGVIDTTALREAILGQENAAWFENKYRQKTYHHHDQTQSIVMVFTDASNWPDSNVRKEPGWERLADVAVQWRPNFWPVEKSRRIVTHTNHFIVGTVSMCRLRLIREFGSRSMADRTSSKSGKYTR